MRFARCTPEMMRTVNDARWQIRPAGAGDADAVADLAAELAQSFPLSRTRFHLTYPALLTADGARLLLAVHEQQRLGYLLGFQDRKSVV